MDDLPEQAGDLIAAGERETLYIVFDVGGDALHLQKVVFVDQQSDLLSGNVIIGLQTFEGFEHIDIA